jgi:3-oxoacyl-[acyl-carrier protein] reductase
MRQVVVLGNVSVLHTAEALVKAAAERWNRLDILVNGATVTRDAMVHLMPDEWFQLVMDVNVKGAFPVYSRCDSSHAICCSI